MNKDSASGPTCGIVSAATALKSVGITVDPADFLVSSFIGSCRGSTPEQLSSMIEQCGASAAAFTNMSIADLTHYGGPLLTLVRNDCDDVEYDHWTVAYWVDGKVVLLDGNKSARRISAGEFLAEWSGVGIVVGREVSATRTIIQGRVLAFLPLGLVWAMCVLLAGTMSGRQIGKQAVFALAASACLAAVGNSIFGDPFNHFRAVEAASPFQGSYSQCSLDHAAKESSAGRALLVDARLSSDFSAGSIPKAINLPVSMECWRFRESFSQVPVDTPIIVFCQSSQCTFDETVASRLCAIGFTRVAVCDGGWLEYREAAKRVRSNE